MDWSSDVCSSDLEAVAILVEWCRRGGRRVVFLRGRKQRVEHRGFRRAQFLGTTGQHHRLHAELDRFIRVADALAAGRARTARGNHAALEAEVQADVDRRGVTHHAQVSRRVEARSEEHTSELQSLMRISYAVFCLKKKKTIKLLVY